MSALTIDEKLLLVQKMRSRTGQNAVHVPHTAGTGTGSVQKDSITGLYVEQADELQEDEASVRGTFRIRIIVCVLIFSAFFGLYKMNIDIKGHQVKEIAVLLEENKLPSRVHQTLKTMSERMLQEFDTKAK